METKSAFEVASATASKEAPQRKQRRSQSAATRERILRAAYDEFARFGYDGARVDRIVDRAEISKNLLYHHFDGKEDLFIRVMEIVYQEMRICHQDTLLVDLDPREAMAKLVRDTFAHFVTTPYAVNLMNSENLHRAKHIKQSKLIRDMYNPLLENIKTILEKGQKAGVFRDNVDPIELYISISGLGYFYLSNQYTLGTIFNKKLATKKGIEERTAHIVDVIMAYLQHGAPTSDSGISRQNAILE